MAVLTPPYQLPDLRPFRSIQHRMRLAGGAVVTENGTLQSEDYIPGIQGWCIFGDGSVEFNDGTFRGDIDATGLNLTLTEADDGAIEFYDINDNLVGRLSAGSWEIGDLETPGRRTTIDPIGGIRFRSDTDELTGILDEQGLSIRDETTGIVVAELTRDAMRLRDVDTADEIVLSTRNTASLFKPRYTSAAEGAPVNVTLEIPAATKFATNDLELGHTSAYKRGTAQSATSTPPAGWTEVVDNDYGVASTLHTSLQRRAVATGTAGTVTSSQSNWDTAIGTHIIIKGVVGGTTPSVRSTSTLEETTTATTVLLSMSPPSGLATGDMLLAFIAMGNSVGSVPTGWVTPEGWVFLGASVGFFGSGATLSTNAVGVWAKQIIDIADEPSTYDTTINFGAGTKTLHGLLVAVQDPAVVGAGAQFNVGGYNLAGPWQEYTPATTGVTLGTGGTAVGRYLVMGKTCFVSAKITLGTGGSFTGTPTFGLPFAVQGATGARALCHLLDSGAPSTHRDGIGPVTLGASVFSVVVSATSTFVSATVPFTWAVNDTLSFDCVYEIA